MIISLIVAASTNNIIGKNNQLIWHLPKDLKHFKNTTWAMPVIMGRKTFEAIGNKPLKSRVNIIVTRDTGFTAKGVVVVHSLNDAIFFATENDYKEVFIAGGGEIYKETIVYANKIYLTRVHGIIDGDTYFPEINLTDWHLKRHEDFLPDDKHLYAYSFQLWERK